jgi:hypothetical protein
MKIKHVLTAALLAFVAVSLAAAVADVAGLRGPAPDPVTSVAGPSSERLIAYYFHGSTRCPTCRTIEAHAREAVAPQVEAGSLAWRLLNYEDPAYQPFAAEFDVLCPSLVLVQTRDREVVRWKNLERVWELHDDRTAFVAYVRAELAAFKEEGP